MTNKRTPKHPERYTYSDCLREVAPVPTGTCGSTLYQLLMVGGMTALLVTVDGISSSGASFLAHSH